MQSKVIPRLIDKIRKNTDQIIRYEETGLDDADVVVLCYGITSRVALMAVERARKKGLKIGFIRLIVAWPFPENLIRNLAKRVRGFVVPEINLGQMSLEVERCATGTPTRLVANAGGTVHSPTTILEAIEEMLR